MEKVMLFDKPLSFDCASDDQKKSETRMLAFGHLMPDVDYTSEEVSLYLAYLAGAQQWDFLGGDVDEDYWTTKEGIKFRLFDAEIQKFIEQAQRELQVSAEIFETEIDLSEGIINKFIVDADLAQRIKTEGELLDVITAPSGENGQGV